MLKKTEAVIFDMDGVIIHSEPLYAEMNEVLFAELGVSIEPSDYHRFVGMSSPLMWTKIRDEFSLSKTVEELMELEKERIHKLLTSDRLTAPITGVENLLNALKEKNIRIGLASSSARKNVETVLNKLYLSEYFSTVVCGEDIRNGKPAPDIFLKAAGLLDTSPGRCCVIEDSNNGVRGAGSAGMKCIGYAGDPDSKQDLSAADLIVSSFHSEDVAKIINFLDAES